MKRDTGRVKERIARSVVIGRGEHQGKGGGGKKKRGNAMVEGRERKGMLGCDRRWIALKERWKRKVEMWDSDAMGEGMGRKGMQKV